MPVPSVSITTSSAPRAAPAWCSARIATLVSLSTCTRMSSRSLISALNGSPSSGRWFDTITEPVAGWTRAGMPNPIASTSGAAERASSTASTIVSTSSAWSSPRMRRCTLWCTTRSASTTPPSSLVPPASIPITRRGAMTERYTESPT